MNIYDFMWMCQDPGLCEISVYDSEQNVLWFGHGDEIPPEIGSLEFESFDVPTDSHLGFNV